MANVTALSDANKKKYKQLIDELTKQINLWEKALNEAETVLNNSIGASFKANYKVGAKASTNIQKIIDILQACKNDLKKLITAGNDFYKKISGEIMVLLYGCPMARSVEEAITQAENYSDSDSVIKTGVIGFK